MDYEEDLLEAFRNVCEDEFGSDDVKILTDPSNFYFNVMNPEGDGFIAIVTPKCLWDTEGCVCDQGTANILMEKLGGHDIMESVYEFDGEIAQDPGAISSYLSNKGLEHNSNIDFPF